MKLWHQSRTDLNRRPAYQAAMEAHFRRIADAGTEIVVHGVDPGTYGDNPHGDANYPFAAHVHSLQLLNNACKAEREGYDAFMIMNLPETVQEIAQSLVDIPVVSYGQAAMYTAAMLGRKFAILTMLPRLIPLYEGHVARYGMQSRSGGVFPLGLPLSSVFDSLTQPEILTAHLTMRVADLCERGIDVIIPGEVPVSASLANANLARVGDVPVVDAIGATVKITEMMVQLRRVSGLYTSREGYFATRPPAERLAELDRFYHLTAFGR